MFSLYTIGHFFQWLFIGRFLFKSWYLFLFLAIGWELLELVLPYEFAIETPINKVGDMIVNALAFYLGIYFRKN